MHANARRPTSRKNCIFAGKITEESRLADFENLDDIVHAGVLVAALAKQLDRSLDDFLAQPHFLAFAKAGHLVNPRILGWNNESLRWQAAAISESCFRRRRR